LSTPGNSAQDFTLNDGSGDDPDTTDVNEAEGDTAANTQTCNNIPAGNYTVTEKGDDPDGFTFASLECTPTLDDDPETEDPTSYGVKNDATPKQADITLAAGGEVTCTYTNAQDKQSTLSTVQRFTPQDTAPITGTGLVFDGTVDFKLLKGEIGDTLNVTCDNTGDTVVYQMDDVPLTGTTLTASTNNPGGSDPATEDPTDGYSIYAADAGKFYWKVVYDGTADPDVTSCNEISTVSITNGSGVSNPPTL
jgi:hypothetical protein